MCLQVKKKKCIVIYPFYNELFLYSGLNDGKCEWYKNQKTLILNDNLNSIIKETAKIAKIAIKRKMTTPVIKIDITIPISYGISKFKKNDNKVSTEEFIYQFLLKQYLSYLIL